MENIKSKGKQLQVNIKILYLVLSRLLGESIIEATYQTKELHGGTLGNVYLISGIATAVNNKKLNYNIVHKSQKKWERYSDNMSWRREYDLYNSDLGSYFSDSFRWPKCFYSEISENKTQLWMEYVGGDTGSDLDIEMLEKIAYELGKLQGKLYITQPEKLKSKTNLSNVEYLKKVYLRYRSWQEVYDYIRDENCDLPNHLCKMMIELDENEIEIWNSIEKLPIVLCHRDYWTTNLFYDNGDIRVIDWDTAGWGYFGEDIASLIADETDLNIMVLCYKNCTPEYYRGFSEYVNNYSINDNCIYELILIMFGYRLIEGFKFAQSAEEKDLQLNTLQKIYEIRQLQINFS